jgi:hypothetical protein
MPVILPTVRFDTQRPSLATPSSGVTITTPPTPYLQRIPANVMRMGPRHFYNLPSSALKATYVFVTDATYDIQEGDILVNITLRDNITQWPGDRPLVASTWHVAFISLDGPVILPRRMIYVSRVVTQGTSHP